MTSPPRPSSPVTYTFSVRLSSDERDRLRALALARSLDPSSLVRSWIAEGGTTSPLQVVVGATSAARPRWRMQLALADQSFMEGLLTLTALSPSGWVGLASLIDHFTALQWSQDACRQGLTALIKQGWITVCAAKGPLPKDWLLINPYLCMWGCASAYALEMLEPGPVGPAGTGGESSEKLDDPAIVRAAVDRASHPEGEGEVRQVARAWPIAVK